MYKFLCLLSLFLVFSCTNESNNPTGKGDSFKSDTLDVDPLETDTVTITSDYTMDNVDPKERKEFRKNLAEIEKKHGAQWDFCTCAVKNDSINKAFSSPVSDKDFDRLSARFDVIDAKCKAFLVQNPNVTPEERARHEKKVRDCLRSAK